MATIAVIAGLTAIGAPARDIPATVAPNLTVCTEGGGDFRVVGRAHVIASGMFSSIGVNVNWRQGFKGCPAQSIMITLQDHTPPAMHPGALAYATPYEGVHICIFYDRISLAASKLLPILLTHVIAHEIGHILQGSVTHSVSGVMKAHWTQDDFNSMISKPLEFTMDDKDLIRRGAEARAVRLIALFEDRAAR